ncbi:MAG: hypothetical protein IIX93_09860, partial [Clostridia bacterium]|nr:hypothetical protein [Clostridia bacterium]
AVKRAQSGMKKGLKPENGFEPYTGEDGKIDLSENCRFLSKEAVKAAFLLETPGEISPPILDARGILLIRLIGSE